jgi:hypothetical protein
MRNWNVELGIYTSRREEVKRFEEVNVGPTF